MEDSFPGIESHVGLYVCVLPNLVVLINQAERFSDIDGAGLEPKFECWRILPSLVSFVQKHRALIAMQLELPLLVWLEQRIGAESKGNSTWRGVRPDDHEIVFPHLAC